MVDDERPKRKASLPTKKIEMMRPTSPKPEVSDLIGQRLRNYYEAVASEPVPDRFMELLSQLEAAAAAKKPN